MASKISKEEQRWRAESDARIMADYQEILNDKPRMARAIKMAKEQAKDLTRRADAMRNASEAKAPSRSKRK